MRQPYVVQADWDADAGVWVATSEDVPGLVTEAETIEALNIKLERMVPEMLETNAGLSTGSRVTVELVARRFSVFPLNQADHRP